MFARSPAHHGNQAFTLVEIIVIIVILGIVASVVIISASGATEATTAAAGADIVARDLELARSEAERTQSYIVVTFAPSTDSYSIADSKGNVIIHPIKKTAETIYINNEVDTGTVVIDSASFGTSGVTVVFNPYGEPVATDKTTPIASDSKVMVRCGDSSYAVRVAPITGRVLVNAN